MGKGLRAFVATLLTLLSLSVLSLHVALCLHYPSALFAVTLLLNPCLWLFLGLVGMFCTSVLNYRDRRRKLSPSMCFRYHSISRTYPSVEHQRAQHCSPYSKSCCKIPLWSPSVHATAYFVPAKENRRKSLIVTQIDNKPVSQTSTESYERISSEIARSNSITQDDIQNFSCLNQRCRKCGSDCGSPCVALKRQKHYKNETQPKVAFCSYSEGSYKVYVANSYKFSENSNNASKDGASTSSLLSDSGSTSILENTQNGPVDVNSIKCQRVRFKKNKKYVAYDNKANVSKDVYHKRERFYNDNCTCDMLYRSVYPKNSADETFSDIFPLDPSKKGRTKSHLNTTESTSLIYVQNKEEGDLDLIGNRKKDPEETESLIAKQHLWDSKKFEHNYREERDRSEENSDTLSVDSITPLLT